MKSLCGKRYWGGGVLIAGLYFSRPGVRDGAATMNLLGFD